jgi:hypothetical protein
MRILGNLRGRGTTVSNGADQGEAGYDISVFLNGGMKSADGTIEGDPFMLMNAQSARSTELRLQNGSTVTIILTHVRGDGTGTLAVSGPVPGF